jgi:hypothetical protein
MNGAIRGSILAAIAFLLTISPMASLAGGTRDVPGNDSFGTATPIEYSTEVQSGSLNATDTVDYYLIQDLIGDTENDQMDSQVIEVQVRSTGPSGVVAAVYEPNRMVIGTIRSSGEWGKIEFVVPYDGDYYLVLSSDPSGSITSYEFLMGGELGYDNRPYTNNNKPGEFVFTQTRKVSLSLNPVRNIVDYYTIDLPSKWGLEAMFQSDYPLSLTLLTSSFDIFGTTDTSEPLEVRNSGVTPLKVHVRMNYPLYGNISYEPVNKPYELTLVVWSFETSPQIMEQWPEIRTIEEDPADPLILNLSQHFAEENGDPLGFAILSHHQGLSVVLNNVTTPYGYPLYTEAVIVPEANWFGEEDLLFSCWDRDAFVQDGLKVKVSSMNDLPFVNRIGRAVYEGGVFYLGISEDEVRTYAIEYGDIDDPVEEIAFSIDRAIPFMDVNPHNGTMRISPQQRHVGYYDFALIVLDPSGGSLEIPINMTIMAVNDPPLRPEWSVLQGNITNILPGETISLKAASDPDPDGDPLTFKWEWGDGTTSTGEVGTHTYKAGFYGKRFVRLISSDGKLENETSIQIFINSPEDIAIGDLMQTISDPINDQIEFREEWSKASPDRKFKVMMGTDTSCDIVSVRSVRRVNEIQVYLEVAGTVGTDGQCHYSVFIMDRTWSEIPIDTNATTAWALIPSFVPSGKILASASYMGVLEVNSTGTVLEGNTILFTFDIMSLNRSGATLPLNRSDISIFCYAQLTLSERTIGKVSMRSISYDSAGNGARAAPRIKTTSTSGGGSTTIGDIARGPGLFVMIALVIIMLVLGAVGFFLVRRERKKKREDEERFVKDVEKMRAEGRDLFDRVKEEGPKKVSYQELYGQAPPKDYRPPTEVVSTELPGPGLAGAGVGQGSAPSPKAAPLFAAPGAMDGKVDWEE